MRQGDTFGRYTIERELGEGSAATVYLAQPDDGGPPCALKVLRVAAPEVRRRLLSEGRFMSNIRHPNVVAVTEILEVPEGVALVMEYVEGNNLEQHLREKGGFTPNKALELFVGIVNGVAAAHRAGAVHRDIKPANIMLRQQGKLLVPMVTDFGLVKLLADRTTQSDVQFGTPEYMSPEQVRDSAKVDQASDLWSLGALFYEMLTGITAFKRDDVVQVYAAISSGDRVPLSELRPMLSPQLVQVVNRLLQVDKAARFSSAEEVLTFMGVDDLGDPQPTIPTSMQLPHDATAAEGPSGSSTLVMAAVLGAVAALCVAAAAIAWWPG